MKFADYFLNWFEKYKQNSVRRVTQNKYMIIQKQLSESKVGNTEMKKITRKLAQEYIDDYGETHRKKSAYTNRAHLKACFNDAIIDGDAKINPFAAVEVKYLDQQYDVQQLLELHNKKKTLTMVEYNKLKIFLEIWLKNAFVRSPFYTWGKYVTHEGRATAKQIQLLIIYVALKTGARYSEILGLTWEDVLFDTEELGFDKTWDYKNYTKGKFERTKNISSIRKVQVDEDTLAILRFYQEWLNKYEIETELNTLFIEKDKRFFNSTINKTLEVACNQCQIEPITIHKLRHTHASILLTQGIDEHVVAKRLGHSDTTMLHRVYGHLVEETEREDNERIMQLL